MAETISEERAMDVAQKFMKANRPGHRNLVRWNGIRQKTNDEKYRSQEPYYIFTNSDSIGFVIVAGDDLARPILGYSADARLGDKDNLPLGMQDWLNDIERQIMAAKRGQASQNEDVAGQWAAPSEGNVLKQLNTALWGQGYPFNNQCPMDGNARTLSGCVPTAYAILMKYYNYPTRGKGQTKPYQTKTQGINMATRDLEHEYDWDNMPIEFVNGVYTTKQASNVANLMADIGRALQVDYTANVTWGDLGLAQLFLNFDYFPGFQQFKDANSDEDWSELLCAELDQDRPIIYRAEEKERGGHAFILDGYTDNGYFHVNWGWGGDCNGYYALDTMIPYDGADYTSKQSAFLSCVPMPMCEQANVAKVEDTEYPSLDIAVTFAEEASLSPVKISLLDDTQSGMVAIGEGQDVSLELNGKKLDMSASIVVRGKLTVTDNTDEGCINQPFANNEIFVNYGTLVIEGGTFTNEYRGADDEYYRRCVWSDEGSQTIISGGTFKTRNNQTLCFIGDATILGGDFSCKGNSAVISNYSTSGTLDIQGGKFTNSLLSVSDTDYRRALWTTQGSETIISGGSFTSRGVQTLCFNGDATINHAIIDNTNSSGYGCLSYSGSIVTIDGCKLKSKNLFYRTDESSILCRGGYFSAPVEGAFLAEDCECIRNTDKETKTRYPYKVVDNSEDAIIAMEEESILSTPIYELSGRKVNFQFSTFNSQFKKKGVYIINGKKVLY
jgi:hypothetical protein